MILVAGGDSFIWGSELADSPNGGPTGFSNSTFPALLAQQSAMDYVCAAYPGNANNAISRMSINALAKIEQDKFLLVQWTYPQRREFRFNDKWISINSWHTSQPEFSESYFKWTGNNEYYEIYSVLKEILMLQYYCISNNISYLFTTADNHFYCHPNYKRHCNDPSIHNLFNQIDWNNWFFFPNGKEANETLGPRGFYQWAIENKYSIASQGHPLEDAHRDAAILIKEKFNELVKENL